MRVYEAIIQLEVLKMVHDENGHTLIFELS